MPVDKRRRVMTLEIFFFFFLHGPRVLWNRNRLVSLASGREKKKGNPKLWPQELVLDAVDIYSFQVIPLTDLLYSRTCG